MSQEHHGSDPRYLYKQPPFTGVDQPPPGTEQAMAPEADHGEESYQGHGRLAGKVALITGGDSGIGRAVAIAYAREGADVVISYLEEHEDARETARWVEKAGQRAVLIAGDISDAAYCREIVQRTCAELGRIDILVNNAAHQRTFESIDELNIENTERTFRTNVFATLYLSQAALPHMPPGGAIINTSSIQGYVPSAHLVDYAATKGALLNLTKSLAQHAMERGVRVNAVAPGPVWTPLIPATMPDEQVKNFGQNCLFKRPAQPAELAAVYVLLASSEASFISGEVYGVTGGEAPV